LSRRDDGRYLDDGQMPADLVGLTTLESVEDLAAKKNFTRQHRRAQETRRRGRAAGEAALPAPIPALLALQDTDHLPRGRPMVRVLDQAGHRALALDEIAKIAAAQGWIPAWGEARIRGAVESRPDWCISRQRSWACQYQRFTSMY